MPNRLQSIDFLTRSSASPAEFRAGMPLESWPGVTRRALSAEEQEWLAELEGMACPGGVLRVAFLGTVLPFERGYFRMRVVSALESGRGHVRRSEAGELMAVLAIGEHTVLSETQIPRSEAPHHHEVDGPRQAVADIRQPAEQPLAGTAARGANFPTAGAARENVAPGAVGCAPLPEVRDPAAAARTLLGAASSEAAATGGGDEAGASGNQAPGSSPLPPRGPLFGAAARGSVFSGLPSAAAVAAGQSLSRREGSHAGRGCKED